jgi:hypothetical protein
MSGSSPVGGLPPERSVGSVAEVDVAAEQDGAFEVGNPAGGDRRLSGFPADDRSETAVPIPAVADLDGGGGHHQRIGRVRDDGAAERPVGLEIQSGDTGRDTGVDRAGGSDRDLGRACRRIRRIETMDLPAGSIADGHFTIGESEDAAVGERLQISRRGAQPQRHG